MRYIMLAVLGLMLSQGIAWGQKKAKEYQKVKKYDFTGDTIDGQLVRPQGELVDTLRSADRTSLIRIRTDFIREILKSAEDL